MRMANTPTIAVIDYHKGNLSSVARGLARAGAEALVTDDPATIRTADGIVLPGVGSFFDAIAFMHETGQDQAVIDAVARGEGLSVVTRPFPKTCSQGLRQTRGAAALSPLRFSKPKAGAGYAVLVCSAARAPCCRADG